MPQFRLRTLCVGITLLAMWFALARLSGHDILFVWPLSFPIALLVAEFVRVVTRRQLVKPLAAMEGSATTLGLFLFALAYVSNLFDGPYFPYDRFGITCLTVSVLGSILGASVLTSTRISVGAWMVAGMRLWSAAAIISSITFWREVYVLNQGHGLAVVYGVVCTGILAVAGVAWGLLYGFLVAMIRKATRRARPDEAESNESPHG